MGVLKGLLMPFQLWNDVVLKIGRGLAVVAIALMVLAILIQVVFRYVFNSALPWPDEAARFFMLWMTGLIAPTGYRRGGFVAIDMLAAALGQRGAAFLGLVLLFISLGVLAVALPLGWGEVTSFMARASTSSLYYFDIFAGEWEKVPRRWMLMSLFVGVVLLIIVNIELILRALITMLDGGEDLRPIPGTGMAGAE
ncbi:MAG: TRAP transporter small permease subunit [Pseudomonadota bacterium]